MLTKELFVHRTTKGQLRPSFLKKNDKEWTAYAERLLGEIAVARGGPYGELEESLLSLARGQGSAQRVKRARGLAKTLLDKVEVEEVDPSAADLRQTMFTASASNLAALADGASEEDFEAALKKQHSDLDGIRARLYADLPAARSIIKAPEWTAARLLERYNLGLAQGLLLYSDSLRIEIPQPEVTALRRLLQWLKWCRLVADIQSIGTTLVISAEGPASVLDSSRKYGLQLAQFLSGVVRLKKYSLEAQVSLPRKKTARLALTEADGLVSNLKEATGYVPEEVKTLGERFASGPWRVTPTSGLRTVGARGACVPDFELVHEERGQIVAVELFHGWHAGALSRRLDELEQVNDPELVLGVDKKLLKKDEALLARVENRTSAFVFQNFPTARALGKCLEAAFNPS